MSVDTRPLPDLVGLVAEAQRAAQRPAPGQHESGAHQKRDGPADARRPLPACAVPGLALLDRVRVGEAVVITYTEALKLAVVPPEGATTE